MQKQLTPSVCSLLQFTFSGLDRIMFQDVFRSAVYRSLTKPLPVRNETGKGYGTNRKSKTSSFSGLNTPPEEEETRMGPQSSMEEEHDHLQLFQASRGARDLARMIDSLSRAPNLDGRSKFIAKDLLRGARDLQSSLVMLAKLQDDSKITTRPKAKARRSVDEVKKVSATKYKQRSEFWDEDIGFEEIKGARIRHSVDGSCRDFVEEHNGSRKSRFSFDESSEYIVEKKISQLKFRQRSQFKDEYMEEGIGVQNSRFPRVSEIKLKQRSGFVEEENCVEEIMPSKRYGLQESRGSVDGSSRDSIEELRRVIKDSLSRQNLLPESSTDGTNYQSQQLVPHKSRSPRNENEAKGTNVITKLMGLEEVQMNKSEEERKRPSFEIDIPITRKAQPLETTDSTQKTLHEIIAAMQFKGLLKSGRSEEPKSRSFDTSQFQKYSRSFIEEDEIPPIVIMKPLFLSHWEKKLLLDKISATDSIQEEKDYAMALPKVLEREEVKCIVEVPQMPTSAHKLQRKKAFKKREETDGKKEEKEDIRKKKVPISRKNTNHTAPPKPEKPIAMAKNKVSRVRPESRNSSNSVKEKKTVAAKSGRKSTDSKDGKSSNPHEGKKSFSNSRTAHDLPQGVKEEKACNKDAEKEDSKTLHELLQKTGQVIHLPEERTPTRVASAMEEDLMCLLLSSRSFISQAQALFQIDPRQPVYYQRKGIGEDTMRNAKLYLDCGKEFTVRKSEQRDSASRSLTELASEISRVIEILTSYGRVDYNVTSEDTLHLRLERDLRCKEMMANANWDIGWLNCACREGAEQVAGEVEEHILSLLITELAQDLV